MKDIPERGEETAGGNEPLAHGRMYRTKAATKETFDIVIHRFCTSIGSASPGTVAEGVKTPHIAKT